MTDRERERIAKHSLAIFRDVWCDRESDEKPFFNCSKCEFQDTHDGKCALKIFLHTEKYPMEYPQGAIVDERGDNHEID